MGEKQMLVEAHRGMRVRVKTQKGIEEGTVERVDDSVPPFGIVVVKTDGGEMVTVPVGLGRA